MELPQRIQRQDNSLFWPQNNALQKHLNPKGVAVRISATHSCMTTRGTLKEGSVLESSHFTGLYLDNHEKRQEFCNMIRKA